MSAGSYLLAPPYPGPWTADRLGSISDTEGRVLGSVRHYFVGELAQSQCLSRWLAAGPDLAHGLIALSLASHRLLGSRDPAALDDAAAMLRRAQGLAAESLLRLADPELRPDAQHNAPVMAAVNRIRETLR